VTSRELLSLSSAQATLRPVPAQVNSRPVATPLILIPRVIDLMNRNALRIPPYPAVAVRLRRVIARGDYGIGELERIAGEDQSLAATLLRYANSAVYRRVTPTTTLGAAIMRIGATEVARIALALSVGDSPSRMAAGRGSLPGVAPGAGVGVVLSSPGLLAPDRR